jgi:lipopolysaccharide transport system permease protein
MEISPMPQSIAPRLLPAPPYWWDLLSELVIREMKIMYKRSFLGIAWTLISPLLQLLVFVCVFQWLLGTSSVADFYPSYTAYVFIGLLSWNWFQTSLFQATGVIISSRALIRQPGFPKAILPIVVVLTGLFHYLLALPILFVFFLIGGVKLTPYAFLLPLLQCLQFLLTISFSYVLAGINVKFRDTQHTLGVLLQLLFYLTPVFYSLKQIPSQYWYYYALNPMVHIVTAYRQILLWGTAPDWIALAIVAVIAIGLLPIGYWIFRRQSERFVEEI